MKKNSEQGGVACGICDVSLQQASFGFGIADVTHGIVGVAVMMSMVIKEENDRVYESGPNKPKRTTGYTEFVAYCPLWVMYLLLGSFILQIVLGVILSLGASYRCSATCTFWAIASFLTSPVTPMTYCLLGLGRVYEWAAVGEWIFKMDSEELESRDKSVNSKKKEDMYIDKDNVEDDEHGDDDDIIEVGGK